MEIINIPILGWCNGVKNIFNQITKITSKNKNTKFYCFKELVHNNESNRMLNRFNIKIIKDLDQIKDKKNSIVLLQAHGSTKELLKQLNNKNIKYLELTCRFVKNNQTKIIEHLKDNDICYFVGYKNHQESKAILSLDKQIKLIDFTKKNKPKFPKNKKIYITNQTTLNNNEVEKFKRSIKSKNVIFENGCCPEIKVRQSNLVKALKVIDLLIVIGDKNSNNAIELIQLSNKAKVKSILVNKPTDLNEKLIKEHKKIGVCTSASTPIELFTKIYKKLLRITK